MIRKIFPIGLLLLLITVGLGTGWYAAADKYEIKGPVSVGFTNKSKSGLAINKEAIKEYVERVNSQKNDKKIMVTFINKFPKEDTDLAAFHPKSVWGGEGLACGIPKLNKDKSRIVFNFYFSRGYILEQLGMKETEYQVNRFFRSCLFYALKGTLTLSPDEIVEFKNLENEYALKNVVSL